MSIPTCQEKINSLSSYVVILSEFSGYAMHFAKCCLTSTY